MDIGFAAKVVYGVILDAMRGKQQSWPSLRVIAKAIGSSVNTVRKATGQLESCELLTRAPRETGKRTIYRLPISAHPVDTVKETSTVHPCEQGVHPVDTEARPRVIPKRQTKEKTKYTKVRNPDSWQFVEALIAEGSPLKTHSFQEAWEEWVMHRRQIHKKLTECTVKRQIKKCLSWGLKGSVTAIERSIENGWMGLFDPAGKDVSKRDKNAGRIVAEPGKYDGLKVLRPKAR